MATAKRCHNWQSLQSCGHKHRFYKYSFSFLYVITFNKAYGWHILQFYSHILELHVSYDLGLKFPLISISYSIDES